MIDELKRQLDDLSQRVANIIRVGVVSSVDPAAGTARVFFDYQDDTVSYDLPVMTRNTKDNQDYWMPDVGEQVTCLFLPIGVEAGFILGSFYSAAATTPVASQDKRHVAFKDGSLFEFDRSNGKLLISVRGDADLIVDGNLNAEVGGTAAIDVAQDLAVTVGGQAVVDAVGPMTLQSAASIAMTAPTIALNGAIALNGPMTQNGGGAGGATFAGTVDITQDATIGGKSFLGHQHPGDSGGTTGTPI